MSDLAPAEPRRPLLWPDVVYHLQEMLADYPTSLYIVGGAVRDAYLHRPIHDIDLAVASHAIPLARQIANTLDGAFFVLDDERDVGRALVDTPDGRMVIDVTRFRAADLEADLLDRDFTLNAMAIELRDLSRIVDPLGGQADIEAKVLRRCSPVSLSSDPIRALRAVRQSVQLGLRIEAETISDIRSHAPRLAETSPERVRDEFFKLLSLSNPASALRIADTLGVLGTIIPEVEPLHGNKQPAPHVSDAWRHALAVIEALSQIAAAVSYARTDNTAAAFGVGMVVIQLDRFRAPIIAHLNTRWPNERSHLSLLILAALLHEAGSTPSDTSISQFPYGDENVKSELTARRADALRLSNGERQRLVAIVKHQDHSIFWQSDISRRDMYHFWLLLDTAGVDVCLFALADYLGMVGASLDQDTWLSLVERIRLLLEAYFERYDEWVAPPMLVDGNRLMDALGLQPGWMVGRLLAIIREGQAAGEIHTAEEALDLARQYVHNQR
jgi:tRNA nucleotidyltransferase/poly(A) polymerase